MRQISQGVEDISWRQQQEAQNSTEDLINVDAPTTPAAVDDAEESEGDASHDAHATVEVHAFEDHSMDEPEISSTAAPAHGSSLEENPDVHIPDAAHSPQPLGMDIHPDDSAPIPMPAYSTLHKPTPAPAEHVDISEDTADAPISQKRRLEERAASLAPTEPASPPPAPPATSPPSIPHGEEKDVDVDMPKKEESVKSDEASTKRPRDDADKDDNPRETKRPSPPPVPVGTKPKEKTKSSSSSRERAASGSASTSTTVTAPTAADSAKAPVPAPESEVTKPSPAPTSVSLPVCSKPVICAHGYCSLTYLERRRVPRVRLGCFTVRLRQGPQPLRILVQITLSLVHSILFAHSRQWFRHHER